MTCQRCEVEKLTDAAETFYSVLAKVIPVIGFSSTERRTEPAKKAATDELLHLIERRKTHACTHPQPGRPKKDK